MSRPADSESDTNQSLDSTLGEIRSKGWRVAAHYEFGPYRDLRSVWLFTHACGKWIKAEGAVHSELLMLQLALGDADNHHCNGGN